jgi:hypothetical protein
VKRRLLWTVLGATTLLVVWVCAALAGYYFWRSSNDNGPDCTFDNLDCASNRDFFAGVGWLLVAGVIVGGSVVACVLVVVVARVRKRPTA